MSRGGFAIALVCGLVACSHEISPLVDPDNDDERSFQHARAIYDLELYDEAIVLFDAFLTAFPASPRHSEAWYLTGRSRYELGKFDEALTTLVALRAADPESRSIVSVGSPEGAIALWVQNWTSETFDIPADYVLDWSQEFDRNTRRVPTEDVWNNRLLPQLKALRDKISAERKERLIRFRGRCALSTSIALGATLPVVGGWAFEVPQPPARDPWRSDATPSPAKFSM